ncbi:arsenate reductase/protein-tyrosine-phosphatase family protein [Robertkochia aurantiaca]|uniref:arsenate reductase/protein-tyrosine-phosphatase family protein n=1 Tax=Robertkochia aurantiaca TaxID=2873700 RepID=UPI001CCF691B|nr:hypothetical protein [Robertkochia sp. 3YJGBD-33]
MREKTDDKLTQVREDGKTKIMILCGGKVCRTQMAHGYLEFYLRDKADVYSAYVQPGEADPRAADMMAEEGIDITHIKVHPIDDLEHMTFDYIISFSDEFRMNCPFVPSERAVYVHESLPNPSGFEGGEEQLYELYHHVQIAIRNFCLDFKKKYFA